MSEASRRKITTSCLEPQPHRPDLASMTSSSAPPFSILDLAPVPQGSTPGQALRNSRDLAQHAERWGYNRYWLAEHHNMVGIASAATAVAIGFVAGGTH